MLGDISLATNIYLVTGYTDMRKSIDELCAIIMKNFNQEPDGHSIYLFCGKRCDRIKVLFKEPDDSRQTFHTTAKVGISSCDVHFFKAIRIIQHKQSLLKVSL